MTKKRNANLNFGQFKHSVLVCFCLFCSYFSYCFVLWYIQLHCRIQYALILISTEFFNMQLNFMRSGWTTGNFYFLYTSSFLLVKTCNCICCSFYYHSKIQWTFFYFITFLYRHQISSCGIVFVKLCMNIFLVVLQTTIHM